MKLAKFFWSVGSLLINVVIVTYVMLMRGMPGDRQAVYRYMNEHWETFGGHWKAELLLMAMIAVGAFYFAIHFRKFSWVLITVGQLVLLFLYPIMLGGYRGTPLELAEMANQIASTVFLFGNILFFLGVFYLYREDRLLPQWLRATAMVLSAIFTAAATVAYVGIMNWQQLIVVAPVANIIYLINAYYGLKLQPEKVIS